MTNNILELIKKNSNYFALIFCLIFFLTAFFSVHGNFWQGLKFSGFSITSDEASHIPAGFYYLKTQKYFINAEHPPLIKDIAATPLLFLNLNFPQIPEKLKYENEQWEFGSSLLFRSGNNPDLMIFCSRTIIILLNTLLLFLIYYFTKKILGVLPSLTALFLLVFSPNLTAHGALVVFDVPLAFLSLLAILTFSLFLKDLIENNKTKRNFFLTAIFTGLALLTKFQAVFLFISLFLGGLVYILFKKKEFWKKYLLFFIFFSILVAIIVGTIYGLQTINMTVEGLQHQLNYSYLSEFPTFGKDILHRIIAINFFLFNGLIEYLIGLFMIMGRAIGAAQTTFFLGKLYGSEGAGPAYFPVLFLTKETIGFLILLFLAVLLAIKNCFKDNHLKNKLVNFFKDPFNVLCLAFLIIYSFFSITLKLNIGIRHIFPVIFLIYVLVAKKIAEQKEVKFSFFILPWFILIFISWLLAWPNYISYYNISVGGISKGYEIATDSNYDWGGQDVKRLAKWVKENKIEKIYGHIFSNAPLDYYLGDAYIPFNIKYDPLPPKGSLIAVSAFELQNVNYDQGLPESKKYLQFEDSLITRIGTTIFIFEIN